MKIYSALSAAIQVAVLGASSHGASIEDENEGSTRMVLGSKLENPYTVNNMQEAARLVVGPSLEEPTLRGVGSKNVFLEGPPGSSAASSAASIVTTHKYVKMTPRTEADLVFLQDLDDNENDDIVLHDHPLDVEVLQEGDYYVEADVNEVINYSPVYGVLPINYPLPSSLQVEELDRLHEPADDGSEDDIELAALEASGLDPDSASPARVVNHERGRRKLFWGRRYRPNGCIYVWDTSSRSGPSHWAPLRRAKISIGRLFWWHYTHTDDNGCWVSPKKYRGRVYIRAKWRSNIATIRKSWNEMLGFFVSDGLFSMTRSSNPRNYNIPISDNRLWMKGTVHNGLVLYNDYAASEGIGRQVSNANVWVWANGRTTASAPMLKRYRALPQMASIAGFTQSNFWVALVNGIFSLLIGLVPSHLRPDFIFSGISGYKDTKKIHQVVFHEAGHWSHALQAGSWYWSKLFAAEVSNSMFYGGSYGDGTQPSASAGRQIALVEGWATLTENYIMQKFYSGVYNSPFSGSWQGNAKTYLDRFDMNSVPMTRGTSTINHWFLHGLFHDLADDNEDGNGKYIEGDTSADTINSIDDNVYVYDSRELYPIFRYLTSSVWDACQFGNKFVRGYTYDYQDIIDLFDSYGFSCVNYQPPPTRNPTRHPTPGPTRPLRPIDGCITGGRGFLICP